MSEYSEELIVEPVIPKRGRGRPRKIKPEPEEPVVPKKRGRPCLPPELRKPPKPRKPRNSPNPSGRPKKYSVCSVAKKEDGTYDYKDYYRQNKEYLTCKIKCDCGAMVARQFLNNHKKTPKHSLIMTALNTTPPI